MEPRLPEDKKVIADPRLQSTNKIAAAALDQLSAQQFFASINASLVKDWNHIAVRLLDELVPAVRAQSHILRGYPLSRYLHGPLIKKITWAAQKLTQPHNEQACFLPQDCLDDLAAEFCLEKFQDALSANEMGPDFYLLITQSWAGFLDITFEGDLDFYTELHPLRSIEIADVIDELLINANRHGKASKVLITVTTLDKGQVKICATDNGQGVKKNNRPGLGSELFALASNNRWVMGQAVGGGCTVELIITIP